MKEVEMGGTCSRHGRDEKCYTIFVGKPKRKRPFGRPKRNILINLAEIGWEDVNWINLAQDRDHWRDLLNTVMNIRVP
jgi:hypothetical protein